MPSVKSDSTKENKSAKINQLGYGSNQGVGYGSSNQGVGYGSNQGVGYSSSNQGYNNQGYNSQGYSSMGKDIRMASRDRG